MQQQENICDICCDEHNDETITLKCKHRFHYYCVLRSFKASRNTLCPYCRIDGGFIKYNEKYGERIYCVHGSSTELKYIRMKD